MSEQTKRSSKKQRGVGDIEEKNLVNLSRQYDYRVKEMMTEEADWLVKPRIHVYGRQQPVSMLEDCHNITSSLPKFTKWSGYFPSSWRVAASKRELHS